MVVWRSHAQFESWIKETRQAGDPVTLADLEPQDLEPEDNAATYLARVSGEADKLFRELQPNAYAENFSWRTGMTDEQNQKAAEAIRAHQEVYDAIELALRHSRYAWPRDYSVVPQQFTADLIESANTERLLARVQVARARHLNSLGQHDEAANVGLQMLQLARLQDQEPTLVLHLVTQACRGMAVQVLNGVLQTGRLDPATHAAIEEELAKHDSMDCLVHAIKTDRALGMEHLQTWGMWLSGGYSGTRNSYLSVMDEHIAKGTKSHYELAAKQQPQQPALGFARTIEPALVATREAMNRTRAQLRCLRVLNAIHAKGITDEEVDIGSLGLPQPITIDPYTGTTLTIKSTPEGWLVYSVGKDEVDNGGELEEDADVGVGPPETME